MRVQASVEKGNAGGGDRPVSDRPQLVSLSKGSQAVLTDSLAGSLATLVSRASGMVETIAVGAVLGATYLGNTYQAVNALPNIVYYQLLAGSLFASLLVPPLVRHVDDGDHRAAAELAGGFLGTLLLVGLALSALFVAAGPLIMRVLTLGVRDRPWIAAAQIHVGELFVLMFVLQISLYIVAGTGAATMNAHGRFALAAGAPAIENVGIVVVLGIAAVVFGTGTDIREVTNQELLLLGLGTTAAVGLHAAVEWLGARASGLALIPRAGWRDPEIRRVLRRIPPTLLYTGLAASQLVGVFIVADRVEGGLVAFQLALNFFYLPTAIVTWPIARALLPQLSRLHDAGAATDFRDELMRAVSLASFVAIPTGVAYAALAVPLAMAMTFGSLARGDGVVWVAMSLAALAPGVVGECWFILGTYAFYSRRDVRTPVRSMVIRVATAFTGMALTWRFAEGRSILPALGLSLSIGSLVGAAHLWVRLSRTLPPGHRQLWPSMCRTFVASVVMAVPAVLTAAAINGLGSGEGWEAAAIVGATVVGLMTYLGVQVLWHAPELTLLKTSFLHLRPAPTDSGGE
jgi:putative peptidoglycan lipid II flippase